MARSIAGRENINSGICLLINPFSEKKKKKKNSVHASCHHLSGMRAPVITTVADARFVLSNSASPQKTKVPTLNALQALHLAYEGSSLVRQCLATVALLCLWLSL